MAKRRMKKIVDQEEDCVAKIFELCEEEEGDKEDSGLCNEDLGLCPSCGCSDDEGCECDPGCEDESDWDYSEE